MRTRGFVLFLGLSAAAVAQQGTYDQITYYDVMEKGPTIGGTFGAAEGGAWFADYHGGQIGKVTEGYGFVYYYFIPTVNSGPLGVLQDVDGAVWFTESTANKIGLLPPVGAAVDYPVPTPDSGLNYGITTGPDGAIWFTEGAANKIGRITAAGLIAEYPVPTPGSEPYAISAGSDGALWFTEYLANQIGRITTSGAITEYTVGSSGNLTGIKAGPDGALWFLESTGAVNQVGRITTAGAVTEYAVPTPDAGLGWIAQGGDGAMWFTESLGHKIGRITMTGTITEYDAAGNSPQNIAAASTGNLWFTEASGDMGQALACGLGFSASFAGGTLTMNFDLGINTQATFNVFLKDANGTIAEPISELVGPLSAPVPFTREWHNVPNLGSLTVQASLQAAGGQAICSQWATVDTAP